MNPLYEKAKDLIIIRRTSDNKEFEEYPFSLQPSSLVMTDPTNDIVCFPPCALTVGHALSASVGETSSYAFSSSNASYALSASTATLASMSLETSHAFNATSASYAFSASYAQSASYGTNFFAPRVTSSYVSASNIIWANEYRGFKGNFTQLTASDLLVTDVSIETSSYALNAKSASFSNFTQLASSSLGTRGLNVDNIPPMPNGEIQFGVANSTAATFHASTTLNDTSTQAYSILHLPENNKIYVATDGTLYSFNDPDGDFTNVTSASYIGGFGLSKIVYASGSLYVINTTAITRININNVASQSVIVTGLAGNSFPCPLVTNQNHLISIQNGYIQKWDLSGSLIQSTVCTSGSLTASFFSTKHGTVSTDGHWAFFSTTMTAANVIVKILISDITNYTCSVGLNTDFPSGPFSATITNSNMCYLNGYLYVSVDSDGNLFKVNPDTLTYTTYPIAGNSSNSSQTGGPFTDGTHLYLLLRGIGEIWVYLNGDVDSGPIRLGITATPNRFAITNGGLAVYNQAGTFNILSYFFPITRLGINKQPQYALDVAGVINSQQRIQAPTISASTTLEAGNVNIHGNTVVSDPGFIRSSNPFTGFFISSSFIRASMMTASLFNGPLFGTASWALTASFALNGGGGGALASGSSYSITASWADSAKTASYSVNLVQSQSNIPYALTTSVDLGGAAYQVLQLTGSNVYITASNLGLGKSVTVEISASVSGSVVMFPSTWQFFPPAITTIPANGIGILALKTNTTTDSGVRAAFVLNSPTDTTASYALYALNAQTAVNATTATTASYAFTSSNVTGTSNCSEYKVSNGFINSYSNSITCSNADDGHCINLITGSIVYLTGSLSSTFSTTIYQSGSGTVVITGSDASVVLRNRQGFYTLAGQYAIATIIRMPNGDFALGGDLA